jgi:phage portal protein BeeE
MRVDAARADKPVTDHPVAKLFVRPNKWQTWTEFARQMHAAFLLRGNGYAVILARWTRKAGALIPINPDSCRSTRRRAAIFSTAFAA